MKLVNYRVLKSNGVEFCTTSYKEATKDGNRIQETFLTEIDNRTEKEKEAAKVNARKVQEILKARWA